MPSYNDVGAYLDSTNLEHELSEAVADCVAEETPQPLAAIADRLHERAAATAIEWDFAALTADLAALIAQEHCGPLFVRLSFADAAVFSAALGGGRPNAVVARRVSNTRSASAAANELLRAHARAREREQRSHVRPAPLRRARQLHTTSAAHRLAGEHARLSHMDVLL